MRELVVATQCELQGNAKALDGHDRYGADGRADADVDHWVLLPVYRRNLVNHDQGEDGHNRDIR